MQEHKNSYQIFYSFAMKQEKIIIDKAKNLKGKWVLTKASTIITLSIQGEKGKK